MVSSTNKTWNLHLAPLLALNTFVHCLLDQHAQIKAPKSIILLGFFTFKTKRERLHQQTWTVQLFFWSLHGTVSELLVIPPLVELHAIDLFVLYATVG